METLLKDVIARTHDTLAERLGAARTAMPDRSQSRRGCAPVDYFLSETSKHLHAVDEVLLPAARRCHDGRQLVKEAIRSQKSLEVVLFHVKSHEYGSVWERNIDWTTMWAEVDRALADQRRHEETVGGELDDLLGETERARAVERLSRRTEEEPSRPHPHLPHTGLFGGTSRRVTRVTDAWWDMAEGRFTIRPAVTHKRPGLMWQYLLASPRFETDEADGIEESATPGGVPPERR